MREETRKRLERALLMRKLAWVGAGLAAVIVAAVAFYFENLDGSVVRTDTVGGTVVYVGPPRGKYRAVISERNVEVDVRLDDARVAHLLIPREKSPHLGDHVNVADTVHGSGRHTFAWR